MRRWKGGNSNWHFIILLPGINFCSFENFEKYEIQNTLKQKVGRGLRGSGPHSKRIPRKLTGWILRYDIVVENFLIIFQFSLYTHFMSPTWGS